MSFFGAGMINYNVDGQKIRKTNIAKFYSLFQHGLA
jgi:hypothetical protein